MTMEYILIERLASVSSGFRSLVGDLSIGDEGDDAESSRNHAYEYGDYTSIGRDGRDYLQVISGAFGLLSARVERGCEALTGQDDQSRLSSSGCP